MISIGSSTMNQNEELYLARSKFDSYRRWSTMGVNRECKRLINVKNRLISCKGIIVK